MIIRLAPIIFVACSGASSQPGQVPRVALREPAPIPSSADALGYQLVFQDEFDDPTSIDLHDTAQQGYKWYLRQFFVAERLATPAGNVRVKDGVLTLGGGIAGLASIQTAAPTHDVPGWIGTAFAGGAYFEARIGFEPDFVEGQQWPAFWAMAAEHLGQRGRAHWEGHPEAYVRFIESDIFEYDTVFAGKDTYGAAIHDWYGQYRVQCPRGFCERVNDGRSLYNNFIVKVPTGTDWRAFHTYGQLWVPATLTSRGYAQWYFDGRPTSSGVSWRFETPTTAPEPVGDDIFNVIDRNSLVLFLSTSPSIEMRVDWVRVWRPHP